jgi:5-(aminomethyl)-3-furanmethanol phosphate kinase
VSEVIVVKIGGSLADTPDRLRKVLEVIAGAAMPASPIVVVPGGGPFADTVRTAQINHGFDDDAAHAMAMLAMAQYGLMLGALAGSAVQPAWGVNQVVRALEDGSSCGLVWLPQPAQDASELARSWNITSDSLALWLAARLGAKRLVLLKSCPEPASGDQRLLAKAGILDAAFPELAQRWPQVTVEWVFGSNLKALRAALPSCN